MAKAKYEYWLTDEGLALIGGWARDGLTEEDIAHNMGISRKTLGKWKNLYSPIGDTLKKGKDVADRIVENALFKRATGYEYSEEIEEFVDGKLKTTRKYKKQMPPDVTAQIYWLNNRKPKDWRNKPKEEVENSGVTVVFKGSGAEELAK